VITLEVDVPTAWVLDNGTNADLTMDWPQRSFRMLSRRILIISAESNTPWAGLNEVVVAIS